MDVKHTIERLRQEMEETKTRIKWLRKYRKALENLPDGTIYSNVLDFDNLPHEKVIAVVKALGGKWKKSQNTTKEGTVNYEQTIGPLNVRCWAGQPPPNCRMVEVEQEVPEQIIPAKVIPAHTIKVRKMICTGDNEPAVEAIGRAINNNASANVERTETV